MGRRQGIGVTAGVSLLLLMANSVQARAEQSQDVPRGTETRPIGERFDEIEKTQREILTALRTVERQLSEIRAQLPPAAALRRPSEPATLPTEPVSVVGAPVKGSPTASVVIVEFADFQCPFCGDFVRKTLPSLEKSYLSAGTVRMVFRHLPLPEIHPQALMAAESAECAGRHGKFWEMHDSLLADQQRLDEPSLLSRAKGLGLDLPQFNECVRGVGSAAVRRDASVARTLGITVTPSFLIGKSLADGTVKIEHIVTGAKDFATFKAVLEPLLTPAQ